MSTSISSVPPVRGLRFDESLSVFFLRNSQIKANQKEWKVLWRLMKDPQGATRDQLLIDLETKDANVVHKAISELRKQLQDPGAISLRGDVYRLVPERVPEATGITFATGVQNLHQNELLPLAEFLNLIFSGPFDGQPQELLSGLVIAANPFELLLKDPAKFFQSLAGGRRWTLILSEPHRIAPALETLYSVGKSLDPIERSLRFVLSGPVLGLPRVFLNWRDSRFSISFGVHLSSSVAPGSKAWFTGEGITGPDWEGDLKPRPGAGILSVAEGIEAPGTIRSSVLSEFRAWPAIAAQAADLISPQ
jgi:hypothetical protein